MDDTVCVNLSDLCLETLLRAIMDIRAADLISCQAFAAVSEYRFQLRREDRSFHPPYSTSQTSAGRLVR
jgi:hypothetical protein